MVKPHIVLLAPIIWEKGHLDTPDPVKSSLEKPAAPFEKKIRSA